jgi:hypothetical protein
VVLAALTMGLAFAHTLELPQKLAYEAATWTQLQHGLYRYFAMVGGPLEVVTVIAAVVFALRGPVSVEQHLGGVGGGLLGAAHPGDQAGTMRAMAPLAVSVNRWAPGRAWPEARLVTGNSIEVVLPAASCAYACGQGKRRLDAPRPPSRFRFAPRGRRGWTGNPGWSSCRKGRRVRTANR